MSYHFEINRLKREILESVNMMNDLKDMKKQAVDIMSEAMQSGKYKEACQMIEHIITLNIQELKLSL